MLAMRTYFTYILLIFQISLILLFTGLTFSNHNAFFVWWYGTLVCIVVLLEYLSTPETFANLLCTFTQGTLLSYIYIITYILQNCIT